MEIFEEGVQAYFPAFQDEDPQKLIKIEDEESWRIDLEEKMNDRLSRALNAKNPLNLNIPYWVWLIIAFLARWDIYNVATTPVVAVPVVLIITIGLYAYKAGYAAKLSPLLG